MAVVHDATINSPPQGYNYKLNRPHTLYRHIMNIQLRQEELPTYYMMKRILVARRRFTTMFRP